jgi:uncharacterized protein YkwD
MRKLILIIGLIYLGMITFLGQINNFNVNTFNKKVYQKINDYRKKNNIDTLIYSKASEELVSKVNVNKMTEKSLCYHPDVNFYDYRKIGESLFIEYYKKLNLKREYPEFDSVWYAEISAFTSKKFNNYDEMVEYFLNGWINSPKHREILNTNFKLSHSGICSTYIKKGKEGYYVSFNFIGMIITNN